MEKALKNLLDYELAISVEISSKLILVITDVVYYNFEAIEQN